MNVIDDNSTNTYQYLASTRVTSGSATSLYVSTSKLYYNPSDVTNSGYGTLNVDCVKATLLWESSDLNLKENIEKVSGEQALATLNAIDGVEFTWKDSGTKSSGVIAQELEKVLPHLVSGEEGEKAVNYTGLVAYLIEANKELLKRIEVLESKI